MVSLIKAVVPGSLLSWIVSLFVASSGSTGGFLFVHRIMLGDYALAWSWAVLVIGMSLGWFVFANTD